MRILVVDDEVVIRKGISAIIKQSERQWSIVGEACDGLEAMEMLESVVTDVVIADIRMPEMDGIEMANRMNIRFPGILVIIISGYAEFSFAQQLLGTMVMGYLLKPTKPKELLAMLDNAEKVLHTININKEKGEKQSEEICRLKGKIEEYEPENKGLKLSCELDYKEGIDPENRIFQNSIINHAIKYIENNFDREMALKDIAGELYLNPSYFCKLFKKQIGTNFSDFLETIRIKKAKELLSERKYLCVYEVAKMVGYNDSKYFSQVFKKVVGIAPVEYKESLL